VRISIMHGNRGPTPRPIHPTGLIRNHHRRQLASERATHTRQQDEEKGSERWECFVGNAEPGKCNGEKERKKESKREREREREREKGDRSGTRASREGDEEKKRTREREHKQGKQLLVCVASCARGSGREAAQRKKKRELSKSKPKELASARPRDMEMEMGLLASPFLVSSSLY
jgi:hypothetical protein